MKVILAQPRGFCAGVVRAIDIVERALARSAELRIDLHQRTAGIDVGLQRAAAAAINFLGKFGTKSMPEIPFSVRTTRKLV